MNCLDEGIERNILCYDSDAKVGQFTRRLVTLMKTVAYRNSLGNLNELLVPINISTIFYRLFNDLEVNVKYKNGLTKEFFKKENVALAIDDKNLVVGITDLGKVILGSF